MSAVRPVGLAGLGSLGRPMAERLLAGGIPLRAWDLDGDRVRRLASRGAEVATGPGDLADCEVVLVVVPDDDAVTGLLAGGDGLLSRLPEGSVVVVHSTVLPATARELAAEAGEQERIAVLDAPVTGGPERAAAGDLTMMVGGADDALDRVGPLLARLASEVHHVGPPGAGAAAKLAHQTMLFATLAGALEAMDLAAAHGVSEADVLAVAASGLADSWVVRNWDFFPDMARTYDAGGTPPEQRSWSKDLRDVVLTADRSGLDLPVARLLATSLAARVEARG